MNLLRVPPRLCVSVVIFAICLTCDRAALPISVLVPVSVAAQQPPPPCSGLPPGKHSLLERMTSDFGLTCEQELKIEPLLHDEESVSKPLLRFTSFSPDQYQAVMVKIKLAARRQIRTLLTPDQQKLMDQDMASVAKTGAKGGKGGAKTDSPPAKAALEDEETLSNAVMAYAALTPDEKKAMLLEIKQAARADSRLQLTAEQQKKLDAEIAELRNHK
jgi:hypothetical protein